MDIHSAPHGMNLVVETETGGRKVVYIGRFDSTTPFQVVMHDVDVHAVQAGEDPEEHVRTTATYGVAVSHKDISFDAAAVKRVRLLGEIPKA